MGEGRSQPPEGHARWTIRLLADKAVELSIVQAVHFNTVGRALKNKLRVSVLIKPVLAAKVYPF